MSLGSYGWLLGRSRNPLLRVRERDTMPIAVILFYILRCAGCQER